MKCINKFLIILVFFISQSINAQDISDDLQKIRAAYDNQANWHIKIDTKAWDSNQAPITSHSYTTLIKKRGDDMNVDMDDVKVVINKNYMVTFQKMNKVIAFQKHNTAVLKQTQPMPNITALLDNKDQEIKYKGMLDGKHFYTIKNSEPTIPTIELYFDPNTHLVHKLVYHFIEGHKDDLTKLEMNLSYLDASLFTDATFSEKQFVTVNANGEVALKNKYKDYYLILSDDLSYVEDVNN